VPRVDPARLEATTEAEIAAQEAEDEAEARKAAAGYARCVRRRTGFTQAAFADWIGVPIDTVRNLEQGNLPRPAQPGLSCVSSTAHPRRPWRCWSDGLYSHEVDRTVASPSGLLGSGSEGLGLLGVVREDGGRR
jgi:DNA-binding transcriptional regulator YiaG